MAWKRPRSNSAANLLVLFDISFSAHHIHDTNFMLLSMPVVLPHPTSLPTQISFLNLLGLTQASPFPPSLLSPLVPPAYTGFSSLWDRLIVGMVSAQLQLPLKELRYLPVRLQGENSKGENSFFPEF